MGVKLTKENEDQLKKDFQAADVNKDKYLTYDEMTEFLKRHTGLSGEHLKVVASSFIKAADTNNDGKISYKEFSILCKKSIESGKLPY